MKNQEDYKNQLARIYTEMRSSPENFPETWLVLYKWANLLRNEWIKMARQFKPGWWSANYLGNAGNNIGIRVTDALEVEIYYIRGNSKYDFAEAVHGGRSQYDLKQMLNTSDKVRMNKHGRKYLVIPMKTDAKANFTMTKTGERTEQAPSGKTAIRNIYAYDRASKGNVAAFPQKDKRGRTTTKRAKLVTMTESSQGWIYPAFDGVDYPSIIEEMKNSKITSINKELAVALSADIKAYLDRKLK